MPVDGSRFAIVADVWERDGNLLGFLSWLSSIPVADLCRDTLRPFAARIDVSPLQLTAGWHERLSRARSLAPWNGGSDPLHLSNGSHISAPSRRLVVQEGQESRLNWTRLIDIDSTARRATFVSDRIEGWYTGLTTLGDRLPPRNHKQNWRVDVFVKPIGFLGAYRKSSETGLWFAGQHRYYAIGN